MTREDISEIRQSAEHKDAFDIALAVHRKEHEPEAANFRDCVECKCGYALLLISNLRRTQDICIPSEKVLSS